MNIRQLIRAAVASSVLCSSLGAASVATAPQASAFTNLEQPSNFWMATTEGDVWNFGSVQNYGDMGDQPLNKPIVTIASTPSKKGYWMAASDGGIFNYGDAGFFGSTGAIKLNKPIVGMTPTPSNNGYWMVATDGGIFNYGDAAFFGSTGSIKLNKPIVGMAPTPSNRGYWLVASDGGIFSFGDADFYGSTGSIKLNKPIVAMTSTPSGKGYWLLASDGGVFNFGDAKFYGSMGGGAAGDGFAKIITAADGKGYWLVRNGGDGYAFGSAVGQARPATAFMYKTNTPGDVALKWAMTQLGKPYLWGSSGPNSYDCSGLTSQAWKRANVTTPRIANDQYNYGSRVEWANLRTGDLLFWGPDRSNDRSIDHVGMYIGGGWGINAGGTGTGVNIRNIVATAGWMWPNGVRPAS